MQQSILRPHNKLSYNNEMVLVHANNGNHNGYLIQQKKTKLKCNNKYECVA